MMIFSKKNKKEEKTIEEKISNFLEDNNYTLQNIELYLNQLIEDSLTLAENGKLHFDFENYLKNINYLYVDYSLFKDRIKAFEKSNGECDYLRKILEKYTQDITNILFNTFNSGKISSQKILSSLYETGVLKKLKQIEIPVELLIAGAICSQNDLQKISNLYSEICSSAKYGKILRSSDVMPELVRTYLQNFANNTLKRNLSKTQNIVKYIEEEQLISPEPLLRYEKMLSDYEKAQEKLGLEETTILAEIQEGIKASIPQALLYLEAMLVNEEDESLFTNEKMKLYETIKNIILTRNKESKEEIEKINIDYEKRKQKFKGELEKEQDELYFAVEDLIKQENEAYKDAMRDWLVLTKKYSEILEETPYKDEKGETIDPIENQLSKWNYAINSKEIQKIEKEIHENPSCILFSNTYLNKFEDRLKKLQSEKNGSKEYNEKLAFLLDSYNNKKEAFKESLKDKIEELFVEGKIAKDEGENNSEYKKNIQEIHSKYSMLLSDFPIEKYLRKLK